MDEVDLHCANHPRRVTRVRCSSCGSPICLLCMNETAVGMKCPSCARPGGAAKMERRRWRAGLAGLASSAVMGALFSALGLGRFGLLVPLILGLLAGSAVRAAGRRRPGLAGTAGVATACGLALGALAVGLPVGQALNPRFLVAVAIAAGVAAFTAGR